MGAAFENFSVKEGGEAARVAHPELRKDGRSAPDGIDQKHSVAVDLDRFKDGVDGKASAGNARPNYDLTKRKQDREEKKPLEKNIRYVVTLMI